MNNYRQLFETEITSLKEQGCSCKDWSKIEVHKDFEVSKVQKTFFSGKIKLGFFKKNILFFGGVEKEAGIYDATLHNCQIGNNVYIGNVKNYIANYIIEDEVVIENVDLIAAEGECFFGNNIKVSVLDEMGGRKVPIFDKLSAHTAYILALYRHRPQLIQNLENLIAQYSFSVKSEMGIIGKNSRLVNCRTLKNVKIGEFALIDGIYRLSNGSVNSVKNDPNYLGPGIILENFIIASGTKISDGTLLSNCFVGQGCVIGKNYSAEESLFFANYQGFNGEACSIFAGPYTVTHHKSTLLIAGMFSFLNAGSGSNQSNHMYKLGPIHQGIVERGSKTTSDSYILWPAKIGAFTLVMGRHYKNIDSSDLPFSYLIESNDESVMAPGVNLRSVGTIRDARKWPKRDKRKDTELLDFINFNLLSPFTIQKMLNGHKILTDLQKTAGISSQYYSFQSMKITNSSLIRGIELYEIGIIKFIGNALIKRLEKRIFKSLTEVRQHLKPTTKLGAGKWIDLSGLLLPETVLEKLLVDIEKNKVNHFSQIQNFYKKTHEKYYEYAWTWIVKIMEIRYNLKISEITIEEIIDFVKKWEKAVINLDKMLYSDAKKEFTLISQTSFGNDGDDEIKILDFEQVRGTFENNETVLDIQKHIEKKTILGRELISRIAHLS
jgi:NDP-sugar pyrophosphorylase family protein